MRLGYRLGIAALCAMFCFLNPSRAEELTQAKFEQFHRELKASDSDVWRTIPWKIRLLDAQQIAARESKPIFIWAMDGHPLGCT